MPNKIPFKIYSENPQAIQLFRENIDSYNKTLETNEKDKVDYRIVENKAIEISSTKEIIQKFARNFLKDKDSKMARNLVTKTTNKFRFMVI